VVFIKLIVCIVARSVQLGTQFARRNVFAYIITFRFTTMVTSPELEATINKTNTTMNVLVVMFICRYLLRCNQSCTANHHTIQQLHTLCLRIGYPCRYGANLVARNKTTQGAHKRSLEITRFSSRSLQENMESAPTNL
jgi:hypothetical protein